MNSLATNYSALRNICFLTLLIFSFSITEILPQLSGTKTIPGDYETIAAAVAVLDEVLI
ncbi:MAG: hypothetical protein Q8Q47_02950 [Ignavibacteriaceae bacterium]|jgi:hypothetical protein|nr:hypothetical protein [Ignavibacteriaceae bacterium]